MQNLILIGLSSCVLASGLSLPGASIPEIPYPRGPAYHTTSLTRRSGLAHTSSDYLRSTCGQSSETELNGPSPELHLFTINVTFGSQSFEAIFDTGSSDSWIIKEDFVCLSPADSTKVPEKACRFSSTGYKPDSSFTPIANKHMNTSYSGYYFNGAVGYEEVTLAGIKVPKQEVGLVDLAAADAIGEFSGVVGFAFPGLTATYPGTNASMDVREVSGSAKAISNRIQYSNLMNTMFFVDNLTEPVFSLALSRDRSQNSFGGILALGGIPGGPDSRVNISASTRFSSVPMELAQMQILDPEKPDYQFYVISADSLTYGKPGARSNRTQYIIDSGTPLNYVPDDDAAAVNALFVPKAVLDPAAAAFLVHCNATAPDFGVTIGGQTFHTNLHDMITPDSQLPDGICRSAIQAGTPGHYVLGETFLKNVLAVFDVGDLTMGFAPRVYYKS